MYHSCPVCLKAPKDSNMLDQLRLESYGCKMRVSTALNILGWVWIIISFLSIIVGILLTANIFSLPFDPAVAAGVIMIKIFLIMLVMNFFLLKRNRSGSLDGVKSILRIICNFILSLQMIVDLILLFFLPFILVAPPLVPPRPLDNESDNTFFVTLIVILIVLVLVWLIFLSLGIHGIRKNRKSLINVYIIFNIVLVVVEIFLQILQFPGSLIGLIYSVLLSLIYFILHIGYFVVLYNIMDVNPEEAQEMKPI